MPAQSADTPGNPGQLFSGIQERAYHLACCAPGNPDDALGVFQDAMLGLLQRYAGKPASEWLPLFYTISQSSIFRWQWRGIAL